MGSGRWDNNTYRSARSIRRLNNVDDFAYTAEAQRTGRLHEALDPKRINRKPFGKLESRDSEEHPESNAVLVCLDVTGSNIARAKEAQQRLPNLMTMLQRHLPHAQVAFAANDDFKVEPVMAVQFSDFETDNRADEHMRNIVLVNNGGGNSGESYDLVLYGAARKTILDCVEKRHKKGYLFMYADEPFMDHVSKREVKAVYDDDLEASIPIDTVIAEARELYNIFIIWPRGGYVNAYEQFVRLFGQESVLSLQDPNLICELIASTIAMSEANLSEDEAEAELVGVGVSASDARTVIRSRRRFLPEDRPLA